jgi:MFS family permease
VNTIAKLSPETQRNMVFMLLGGLCFWACMASMLPTLPGYIKSTGASDHEVGIVMGSFAVGLLLFRPCMGQLIETSGHKKVLLLGIAVAAIAPLIYIITKTAGLLIAVRIFHGLSIAAFTTSYSTIVADLSPPENRGELIGYMSLVNPIGMAIGPALGGYLQPTVGDTNLFLTCTALAALSFGFSSAVKTCPQDLSNRESVVNLSNWAMLKSDQLRIPTAMMFAVGIAFGILSVYLPLFVQQQQLPMNAGLFYTMAALSSFGTRLVAGKASDHLGRGLFITGGAFCYGISMLMLVFAQDVPTVLLSGFIEGIGGGTLLPITIALITDRCQPQERPRAYSLCIGGFDLGIFMGGPCVGFAAAWLGYRGLFAIAAAVTFLSTIVFATTCSTTPHRSFRFAIGRGRDMYALPSDEGG